MSDDDGLIVAPMGQRALTARFTRVDAALALYAALDRDPLPGQQDLVAGAQSLLVIFETVEHCRTVAAGEHLLARGHAVCRANAAATGPGSTRAQASGRTVMLDVVYDGPDLAEVTDLTGLSREAVVAAHTRVPWRVAFGGFVPGFAYLTGGDPALDVPRRATPRTTVPAGSVGLAGAYSGVYPAASPGGWQLLGALAEPTDPALWDESRDPPALLRPGMTVQFRAARATAVAGGDVGPAEGAAARRRSLVASSPSAERRSVLTVLSPGLQCTVQDLGRSGFASMGLGPSGAADRGAAMRANTLAGNEPGAAVLEILLGGAEFEAVADVTIGIAGAPVTVSVASPEPGRAIAERSGTASYRQVPETGEYRVTLRGGERLRLGRARAGLRVYLAARGGIDAPMVLGSRATDTLTGIGPAPVVAGDVVRLAHYAAPGAKSEDTRDVSPPGSPARHGPPGTLQLDALPGLQLHWFGSDATARLAEHWIVNPSSDRTAVRLTGPTIERRVTVELPSQGLVRGAIQLPSSDELVAFLADYPVTGGYPVIAVLTEASVDLLAQCRPGTRVSVDLISG